MKECGRKKVSLPRHLTWPLTGLAASHSFPADPPVKFHQGGDGPYFGTPGGNGPGDQVPPWGDDLGGEK